MAQQEYASKTLLKAARNAPYLERDEEHDLALKWSEKQDQQALHKLAAAHMRLVIAIAAKFRHYGLAIPDLVQEGHVGLLEAAVRFDPHRGVRFSTYATWWIRASIQDYVLRNWSIVRGGTSSGQKSLFFNLRRLRAKISTNGKHTNSQEMYRELAEAIGVSPKDVATMDARLGGPDISLNSPVASDDEASAEQQDFLRCEAPLPDVTVAKLIDGERRSASLKSALEVLNERELKIVNQRRLSDEGATLEQLGGELGISKERVRQLESRALEKIKSALLTQTPQIRHFL